MKIKRITLAVLLAATLTAGACAPKVNTKPGVTGDNVLAGAKKFGNVMAVALTQGITLEANLAESGAIDKDIEPNLRQWLLDGKKATEDFNARLATYDHFDSSSKADIAKFLDDAITFINKANNEGILRIKNPRSQMIASGILAGASIAVAVFKGTFDRVQ